jgi:hypothetical protein
MKKVLVILSLGAFLSPSAYADGMAHYRGPSLAWHVLGEAQQSAVIHYHDGREAMLLAIDMGIDIRGSETVWIFPIPSGPDKVVIDIHRGESRFLGNEVTSQFKETLLRWGGIMAAVSVFPVSGPFVLFDSSYVQMPSGSLSLGGSEREQGSVGIVIHERIAKMGLTTELITTKDPEALARYLSGKGLNLPKPSMAILDWYVGKEYSFVVSFTDNPKSPVTNDRAGAANKPAAPQGTPGDRKAEGPRETDANRPRPTFARGQIGPDGNYTVVQEPLSDKEYAEWRRDYPNGPKQIKAEGHTGPDGNYAKSDSSSQLSIFVSFPTKRMYFPLKPTSVYGEKRIPIRILVLGHIKPKLFPGIKDRTKVRYLTGWLSLDGSFDPFWLGRYQASSEKFTEVRIDAPSGLLVDDLWIRDSPPLRIWAMTVLTDLVGLLAFVLYAAYSMLASLAAANISFRSLPLPRKRMALHGLFNCLTMIGLFAATTHLLRRPLPPSLAEEVRKYPDLIKIRDSGKMLYLLLFYVFFLFMIGATMGVIWIAL